VARRKCYQTWKTNVVASRKRIRLRVETPKEAQVFIVPGLVRRGHHVQIPEDDFSTFNVPDLLCVLCKCQEYISSNITFSGAL
jgi:hypothetical protein